MNEDLVFTLFLLVPVASIAGIIILAKALRAAPAKRYQIISFNFALLVFLLSSLLLAGETYYRFFYDATDALDYTKVSERWFQRHYHQNRFGCRDSIEYTNQIQAGKRRITFLGDSFAAGHGIMNVEDRFSNRLRRAHPDWEIHVIARPGFDTTNEIKSIEALTSGNYELDEVVLVYCLNDIQDLIPECTAAVNRIYADVDYSGWLRRNSYFINVLYHRFNALRNPDIKNYFQLVEKGYQGSAWLEQEQRLKLLKDLVESHRGRLSVITFPFLHALGPGYKFQPIHDKLSRFWNELNVPHLDLLSIYSPPQKNTHSEPI